MLACRGKSEADLETAVLLSEHEGREDSGRGGHTQQSSRGLLSAAFFNAFHLAVARTSERSGKLVSSIQFLPIAQSTQLGMCRETHLTRCCSSAISTRAAPCAPMSRHLWGTESTTLSRNRPAFTAGP